MDESPYQRRDRRHMLTTEKRMHNLVNLLRMFTDENLKRYKATKQDYFQGRASAFEDCADWIQQRLNISVSETKEKISKMNEFLEGIVRAGL